MTKIRLFIFLTSLLVVAIFGYIASLYARGYRLDPKTFQFIPNGLLVVSSDPNGAQIFIEGELKTATNATISLTPGNYEIRVEKEGFLTWTKILAVEKEIVTQVDVSLFPAAPSLSAVTFSGAFLPTASSDFSKIAYGVPHQNLNQTEIISPSSKGGLWLTDAVNLPIGFGREPRQLTNADVSEATWQWSPDGREIMITTKAGGVFLINIGEFTSQEELVNIAPTKEAILDQWQAEADERLENKLARLPDELEKIFKESAHDIRFSPDENKVLYTASESATIPEGLISPLPGSSTQNQERELAIGRQYVFDLKEDRNFFVSPEEKITFWFPNSAHLIIPEAEKITIMDYDGTNAQTVYSGSFVFPHAYPYANTRELLILTNLGSNGALPNLYSLKLK